MRLEGKVATITGAAAGIGKAIAYQFARDGAAVVLGDIDEAGARAAANEIAEETGAKTLGMRCDVVTRAEVDALVAAAAAKFGRIDVMVANAGIAIGGNRALDATEEDWDRTMDINGKGVVFSNQSAARQMIAEGHGGSIINIASIAALNGVSPMLMAYCASKAAVVQLTKCFALDLAPHGIRVSAIGHARKHGRQRPARPHGAPIGHRQHGRLPRQRRFQLRHRPGLRGRWRPHGRLGISPRDRPLTRSEPGAGRQASGPLLGVRGRARAGASFSPSPA